MKRAVIASVILLSAVVSAQAYTDLGSDGTRPAASDAALNVALQHHHARKSSAARSSSAVVIYNRDSKDPNVGWHWEGGMRTCHQDCDNPEIPGSGFTCKDVQALGMAMRECDKSN